MALTVVRTFCVFLEVCSMPFGGQTFRAFRPSHFAPQDDLEETGLEVKQDRIRVYIQRAEAGQPLFDQSDIVKSLGPSQGLSLT